MTPEVKQRIEQIRQGIVPEGYKKTKSDIVPVDWKESSIGEYICEYTEKTTIPNQYPVLTSARTGLMLQTEYYSNRQVTTENNVGYNILPFGYVTFRSRSDDGRFRFNENRIIKRGIISYFYPVFSFSEEVCHEYMLYLLNFSIYRRMYPYAEGTAQQVLSLKKLGQLKYSLPLVAEQKKIAEILATQDKAIELQARKIEELKRFKKGCLEKMFPRKGQKVPEKRFPGFTGDWEQRKVSTIASDTRGGGTPATSNETYWSGNIPWIQSSDLSEEKLFGVEPRKYISRDGLNNSATQLVPENSIAVVTRVGVGKLAFMPFSYTTSQDFLSLCKLQTEPHFTVYALYKMLQGELQAVQGTSIKGMTKDDLLSKSIFAPKDEVEQQQLGSYFRNLDTLITLHQRKLEEMKKQKKALMQLLLTGIVKTKGEVR